jgi:hypothetical protein
MGISLIGSRHDPEPGWGPASVGHQALPRKISMPIRARLSELTLGRDEID